MMEAIPGGGTGLPGPLEDKHFRGETQYDFETALKIVHAGDEAAVVRAGATGLTAALARMLRGHGRDARGQDRHVAFDGFRGRIHDDKAERDRRYGRVYSVVEHANAYIVNVQMPRRVPDSALKKLWKLPDEMPDYEYSITLEPAVLAIRAGVRGEAMRRLPYISPSFPADFLTRIEFDQPVSGFNHRLRDKVLQIVVFKAASETTGHSL